MSNRERWTVYPLLFLALGIALRDKVTNTLETGSISCEELVIAARDGKPRMRFLAANQAARIVIYGDRGKPALTLGTNDDGNSGKLLVCSANGDPQVVVRSIGNAGAIETVTSAGEPQVLLGSTKAGGVVTTVRKGKTAVTLGAEEGQDISSLSLHAPDGNARVVIRATPESGTVETLNSAGVPQVILGASKRGGVMTTIDNERKFVITIGHEPEGSGVFALNTQQKQTLALPLMPQGPQQGPQKDQQPKVEAKETPEPPQIEPGKQPSEPPQKDGAANGAPAEPSPSASQPPTSK